MAVRWISLIVLGLALSSCSDGGFIGRTGQFSGVWLYQFEGSSFIEGATQTPRTRPPYDETAWLEWAEWPELEALMDERIEAVDCHPVQPFRITFVGRKTHHPFGGAGHLGLWKSEVTVLRPISAERLGPTFCYDG